MHHAGTAVPAAVTTCNSAVMCAVGFPPFLRRARTRRHGRLASGARASRKTSRVTRCLVGCSRPSPRVSWGRAPCARYASSCYCGVTVPCRTRPWSRLRRADYVLKSKQPGFSRTGTCEVHDFRTWVAFGASHLAGSAPGSSKGGEMMRIITLGVMKGQAGAGTATTICSGVAQDVISHGPELIQYASPGLPRVGPSDGAIPLP